MPSIARRSVQSAGAWSDRKNPATFSEHGLECNAKKRRPASSHPALISKIDHDAFGQKHRDLGRRAAQEALRVLMHRIGRPGRKPRDASKIVTRLFQRRARRRSKDVRFPKTARRRRRNRLRRDYARFFKLLRNNAQPYLSEFGRSAKPVGSHAWLPASARSIAAKTTPRQKNAASKTMALTATRE